MCVKARRQDSSETPSGELGLSAEREAGAGPPELIQGAGALPEGSRVPLRRFSVWEGLVDQKCVLGHLFWKLGWCWPWRCSSRRPDKVFGATESSGAWS